MMRRLSASRPHTTSCGTEEGYEDINGGHITSAQPRKRTSKITRRKEPTVDVSNREGLLSLNCERNKETDYSYDTLEATSHNNLEFFQEREDCDQATRAGGAIQGWKENDHAVIMKNADHTPFASSRGCGPSRESLRRLYSSRLDSRLSRRRDQYCFEHFDDVDDHIIKYNNMCSYSYLVMWKRNSVRKLKKDSFEEEKEREEEKREDLVMLSRESNDLQQHGKPRDEGVVLAEEQSSSSSPLPKLSHLHQLALRLGVSESINEPSLLQSSKPTTPSIRRRGGGDAEAMDKLMIGSPTGALKHNHKVNESHSSNNTDKHSSKSTPDHRKYFPLMSKPDKKKSNQSTISLAKYLHVNSNKRQQQQKPTTTTTTNHTVLPDESTSLLNSNNTLTDNVVVVHQKSNKKEFWPTYLVTEQSAPSKDEVIRRKADSLGLLSHKWAKNFIERGFLNGHLPRKVYYDFSNQKVVKGNGDIRPSTQCGSNPKDKTLKSADKLEKLENVYGKRNASASSKRKDNSEGFKRTSTGNNNRGKTSSSCSSRNDNRLMKSSCNKTSGHNGYIGRRRTPNNITHNHWGLVRGEVWSAMNETVVSR